MDNGVRENAYDKARKAVYNLIRDSDKSSLAATLLDGFIIVLIFTNVVLIILETYDFSDRTKQIFYYIEFFSVMVFTIEYFLRIWTADLSAPDSPRLKMRLKFIFSKMGLIDLLAILPFYLPLIFTMDLRFLRMLRLLRLLRLLKLSRYTSAFSTVGQVIQRKASQLITSMLVVLILMVMASLFMYSVEHDAQPEVFQNAFSGFWWAVATLTTVGYGDIYPITTFGKVLGALIALLGIGFVAMPTGIISAGFIENITYEKEKLEEKHFCPYCGKNLD